jgi:hypothetical protein
VIKPSLSTKDVEAVNLLPAFALTALGGLLGYATAEWTRTEGGRIRVFHPPKSKLQIDLNPRVWNWFLQEPQKGLLYRITFKGGNRVVMGQVTEYSSDPDDDVQELVMRFYSESKDGGTFQPVRDSKGMLVSRDDIEKIELLTTRVDESGKPISPVLVQPPPRPPVPVRSRSRRVNRPGPQQVR